MQLNGCEMNAHLAVAKPRLRRSLAQKNTDNPPCAPSKLNKAIRTLIKDDTVGT